MIRPALALSIALLAAACASAPTQDALNAATPTEQFPFHVSAAPDEVMLAVHPTGVSPSQAAAVETLFKRWREAGGDPIIIRAPAGGPQAGAAFAMADQVSAILVARGAPQGLVRVERYDAGADPAAPLVVGFQRYRAEIPVCGQKWDNLTGTNANTVHSNFGCAVSANMAAQVANPRDLVEAQPQDEPDAARRAYQLDLYRRGQDPASTAPSPAGVVSNAVR